MTDETLNTPADLADAEALPVDFDLDAWINGGSVGHRSVAIFARPDLAADMQEYVRRIEEAKRRAKAGDEDTSLGDRDEVRALEAEAERIYDEWMASKGDWRIRALDIEDDLEPIQKAMPVYPDLPAFKEKPPVAPRDHDKGKPSAAYSAVLEAYEARRAAFLEAQKPERDELEKERATANDEANMQMIAAAVVSITFANGQVVHDVTVEQLRRMRKTIGPLQVAKLLQATHDAMYREPVLPIPFSPSTSEDAQE